MEYATSVETWAEFAFASGKLQVEVTIARADEYGPPPQIKKRQLVFERAGERTILPNIAEIGPLAQAEGVDLTRAAADRPAELAKLLATHAGIGSVVTESTRWSWLPEEYGIPLSGNAPRVREGTLVFLAIQLAMPPVERRAQDVAWNLTTLECLTQERKLATRR